MYVRTLFGKLLGVIFAALLTLQCTLTCDSAFAADSSLAPRTINNNSRKTLLGNVHPLVKRRMAVGVPEASMQMDRMILSLKLTPEKQSDLNKFLAEQEDPASPNYHHWLTHEEFASRFGPTSEDILTVTNWLSSQGFNVDEVAKGRTWINFSGTATTVEAVFQTQLKQYVIDGQLRHANVTDPTIPYDLSDIVAGVVSLHNIPLRSMIASIEPAYTSGTKHYLSPNDFATIYNLNPLYADGIDGTGQSIAIVGRTNPSSSNWTTFRAAMGLSANPPQVIVNGPDPGDQGAVENDEADLDVEWSGAVARNATIKFVVSKSTNSSDGVSLSAQYIVNNNLAPIMSTSFGLCESDMGSSERSFWNNLWSQAAALVSYQ